MKKSISYCVTVAFYMVLLSGTYSFAQGGPPGGGGPGPCTNPPCRPPNPPGLAPIDGGVIFLLDSGLVLGVTSLRKKSK